MLSFGTGSNLRHVPVHDMVAEMDQQVCATLPVFHALTGCDTVSCFGGRGKKSAWNTWKVFPEVTAAFAELLLMDSSISDSTMAVLERFVVVLYDRTSGLYSINESRKHLFTQKGRSMENLPPTFEALKQHIKRAMYQANCWNKALCCQQELPKPIDWGWKKTTSGWAPPVDYPTSSIRGLHCTHTMWV